MKSSSGSKEGFTLIELLVTVFVLAIGLGVIFALLTLTADVGRDQRDEARLRRFAESVFASIDWGVNGSAGVDAYLLPALTVNGEEQFRILTDGEEGIWPPLNENELEPRRIRYRVELVENANGLVEATVTAGMWADLEPRVYTRTFFQMEESL